MAWALRKPIPEPVSKPCPKPRRKPHTKSFSIVRLYPSPQTEPQHQAEMLLHEVARHCGHAIGSYVPAADLERFYAELANERGWEPRSWHVIGRELGKLTRRVSKRRDGRRFLAYKIPRAA